MTSNCVFVYVAALKTTRNYWNFRRKNHTFYGIHVGAKIFGFWSLEFHFHFKNGYFYSNKNVTFSTNSLWIQDYNDIINVYYRFSFKIPLHILAYFQIFRITLFTSFRRENFCRKQKPLNLGYYTKSVVSHAGPTSKTTRCEADNFLIVNIILSISTNNSNFRRSDQVVCVKRANSIFGTLVFVRQTMNVCGQVESKRIARWRNEKTYAWDLEKGTSFSLYILTSVHSCRIF